jgi:transposase
MIQTKFPDTRLFYGAEELYRPSRTNYYARLNAVICSAHGSWRSFCSPLRSRFSCAQNGRPVDPTVYFKAYVIGYLENIVYDTDLAERIGDSLAIREFLGYGPTERTPDHSSLSRVRGRLAEGGVLEQMLDRVIAMCVKAGLVCGEEVATDSTLIPANASLSSLRSVKTGITVKEHLKQLRESGQKPTVSNEEFRSPSDPDARITKKGSCVRGMYHKVTHVTDAKSQVILAAGVATADTGEGEAAIVPLEQAKQRLKDNDLKLGTVVADTGYDDCDFHARVEAMDATPLSNYQPPKSQKPEGFAKHDFTYDAERNLYVCPNQKELRCQGTEGERIVYKSLQVDCADCPLKALCLSEDGKQRIVRREKNEAARERNIARCHTDKGRERLKRRKAVVEPPFGHLKEHGGLREITCRTTKRAQAKITVGAITWDLMKLARKVGDGLLFAHFRRMAKTGARNVAGKNLWTPYIIA